MFTLTDVRKIYRKRQQQVTAFQVEHLEIAKGDYVAIVGPSGCGKTTLLSMLGGMLSPDDGDVRFDGVALYTLSLAERAKLRRERIGFVFQTFNLLTYLTAMENVLVPLYLSGCEKSIARDRAVALLDELGLRERLDHKPGELSTGQQQRVALARTLANDPDVILADEPTGNLDPDSRAHILAMFDDFRNSGKTIVMVTHDRAAAQMAGRQLRLSNGKLCLEERQEKHVA